MHRDNLSSKTINLSSLNRAGKSILQAIKLRIPIFVWGPPGIGKTTIIEAIARALERPIIIEVSSNADPVDYRGSLRVVEENVNGKRVVYTKNAPSELLINLIYKYPNAILFIDEFTNTRPDVQAALLRLLQKKSYMGLEIPETVSIVVAGNPYDTAANPQMIKAPTANRFIHVEMLVDDDYINNFINYFPSYWGAYVQYLDEENNLIDVNDCVLARSIVASYISYNRNDLYILPKETTKRSQAWPSPRTWEMVAQIIASAFAKLKVQNNTTIGQVIISEGYSELILGAVGSEVGAKFMEILVHELPKVEDVLEQPSILNKYKKNRYSLMVITNMVINYTASRIMNLEDNDNDTINRLLDKIIDIFNIISPMHDLFDLAGRYLKNSLNISISSFGGKKFYINFNNANKKFEITKEIYERWLRILEKSNEIESEFIKDIG